MKRVGMLVVFVVVVLGVGAAGSLFEPGTWYEGLAKPTWTPPGWLFGPVWTVLYLMIGVSGWLVWDRRGFGGAKTAMAVYAGQLILNGAWSLFFFGMHRPGLAMVDIAALFVLIVANAVLFWRIRAWAGVLLLPYLGWVGFAGALNWQIWRMNL